MRSDATSYTETVLLREKQGERHTRSGLPWTPEETSQAEPTQIKERKRVEFPIGGRGRFALAGGGGNSLIHSSRDQVIELSSYHISFFLVRFVRCGAVDFARPPDMDSGFWELSGKIDSETEGSAHF